MPFANVSLSSHQPSEKYCYRCGNLLGRSRGVLYYWSRPRPSIGRATRSAASRVRYAFREVSGFLDRSCRLCDADTEREWREDVMHSPPINPLRRLAPRPVRSTIAVTVGGLPAELPGASFPVYGLTGQPLGLELRSVAWETGRLLPSARVIGLLYEDAEGSAPRSRLLLESEEATGHAARAPSPERELRAIVEVVRQHGARGQRERFIDRGNVFRHWNLGRLADAYRRSVVMHVGGAPTRVELAQWSDPQPVTLAHVRLEGAALLAAAVDVAPVRLLAALKGLAPLGREAG